MGRARGLGTTWLMDKAVTLARGSKALLTNPYPPPGPAPAVATLVSAAAALARAGAKPRPAASRASRASDGASAPGDGPPDPDIAGNSDSDAATDHEEVDPWAHITIEPNPTAFHVVAYHVRDRRDKVCAPGVEVWLDPGTLHEGAYLPWGTTVMGHRVTGETAEQHDGWIILIHDHGETSTRLWAPTHVQGADDKTWRPVRTASTPVLSER